MSDIHCNLDGLNRGLELLGDVDRLLVAGDLIFQYRFSNDVVNLLRSKDAAVVQGNHEIAFFGPLGGAARARTGIDQEAMEWLGNQPKKLRLVVDGLRIVMFHGSPWPRYDDYLFPGDTRLQSFADLEGDVVIYGHTHHRDLMWVGETQIINPGSAGLGRDERSGRMLSCALLDTGTREVQFFDYADPAIEKRLSEERAS